MTVPNKQALMGQRPAVQAVFLWMCHFADRDGTCFPSRLTLAKHAGIGKSSVDRAIEELIAIGILAKKSRFRPGRKEQDSNLYQILILEGGGVTDTPRGVTDTPGVASQIRQGGVTDRQELNPGNVNPIELNSYKEARGVKKEPLSGEAASALICARIKAAGLARLPSGSSHREQMAALEVINECGLETVYEAIDFAGSLKGEQFPYTVTSPSHVRDKIDAILARKSKVVAGTIFTIK